MWFIRRLAYILLILRWWIVRELNADTSCSKQLRFSYALLYILFVCIILYGYFFLNFTSRVTDARITIINALKEILNTSDRVSLNLQIKNIVSSVSSIIILQTKGIQYLPSKFSYKIFASKNLLNFQRNKYILWDR